MIKHVVTEIEARLLSAFPDDELEVAIPTLAASTHILPSSVQATLSTLEGKGLTRQSGRNHFVCLTPQGNEVRLLLRRQQSRREVLVVPDPVPSDSETA